MSSFKLLTLILIIWWQFAVPTLGRRLHPPTLLQQLLYQVSHQGCVSRNFNGCCPHGSPSCCINLPGLKTCYCDQECFGFDDCCTDIYEIQCYPPGSTTTASPPTSTASPTTVTPEITTTITTIETTTVDPLTCAGKDVDPDGCCNTSECYIILDDGLCFCDRACHASKMDKCCDDVTQMGCYPRNCIEAGIPTCCMDGNLTNCRVEISHNNFCYCDQNCSQRLGGCCSDVSCPQATASPTTVTSEIPTTTTTSENTTENPLTCAGQDFHNGLDGCCNTSLSDCHIDRGGSDLCFCDRSCYASKMECCGDIAQMGCYRVCPECRETARNCADMGHDEDCCIITDTENCRVQKSATGIDNCYCDRDCYGGKNGRPYDCCPDIQTICPQITDQQVKSEMENLESLLEAMEAETMMYEIAAAAFWRRYNKIKREEQRLRNRRM